MNLEPISLPWISVIIPTYGERGVGLTRKCLHSLRETHAHLKPEITVVSDGDVGADLLADVCDVYQARLIIQERGGFAKACNRGLVESNGIISFLVNNDIEFYEPTLQIMASAADGMGASVVGCKLIYPNRTLQHAGVFFVPKPAGLDYPLPGWFDHVHRNEHEHHPGAVSIRNSFVTGALFGITQWALGTVGLLDTRFGFSCEDIDYQLRCLESGKAPVYVAFTGAIHREGATRGATPEKKMELAPDVARRERESLEFLFQKWIGFDWRMLEIG